MRTRDDAVAVRALVERWVVGARPPLRQALGLRKVGPRWRIAHEHHPSMSCS